MTPKFVVYECEECGRLFYREVAEVLTDDVDHCEVKVALLKERNSEDTEEFPMCVCLGGTPAPIVEIHHYELENARRERENGTK